MTRSRPRGTSSSTCSAATSKRSRLRYGDSPMRVRTSARCRSAGCCGRSPRVRRSTVKKPPTRRGSDLQALAEKVEAVDTFADKWVAHLDREHDTPPLTIADMNDVIEFLGPMWERWYLQVTDIGTSAELGTSRSVKCHL